MTNNKLLSRSDVTPVSAGDATALAKTEQRPTALPITDAVTLRPEEPIARAIRLLTRSRLTALPVVDAGGSLVGLLTESDLLTRLTSRKHSWWATLWMENTTLIQEYRKTTGATVGEVMGPPPIPVPIGASVHDAADLLAQQGLRELPVIANGRIVGMVTRPSLLALQELTQPSIVTRTDAELVAEMKTRLHEEVWVTNRGLHVEAKKGVLFFCGMVANEEEQAALGAMASSIAGCTGVENHTFPRTALRGRWA